MLELVGSAIAIADYKGILAGFADQMRSVADAVKSASKHGS
jgi:hypothetical protein